MFSFPEHITYLENFNSELNEECFDDALKNEEPLEICFGNTGGNICYWKDSINIVCCRENLVIDANSLMVYGVWDANLIFAIADIVRHCDQLKHIYIGGSHTAMHRHFKIVSKSGSKKTAFASWIAGINVLKGHHRNPLVVTTATRFDIGTTYRVEKFRYI
ncbi:MAG: hypothetical protein O3B00_08745 [archaeon]|nr:hypothetical protein [archaeon]